VPVVNIEQVNYGEHPSSKVVGFAAFFAEEYVGRELKMR
jgi:hypothetical protein